MLKKAARLLERNPIYAEDGGFGGFTLDGLHQDVSKYELPSGASEGVQRSFDAARHTYIYSYFSYDLLTPAVSQLFACLELALRNRLGYAGNKTPGLFDLLKEAKEKSIISFEGGVLHKLRNIFQHGTEAIIDPNTFLSVLEQVAALLCEMYDRPMTASGDPLAG